MRISDWSSDVCSSDLWLEFPIDDRRRTGLLYPVLANTKKTGLDIREPVYINLAPNYDMTFTPRYMSDRGTQLELTGRHLLSNSEGDLGYQYLDHDRATDERRTYLYYNDRSLDRKSTRLTSSH